MRTIIAGSRDLNSYDLVRRAVEECGWTPTVVLSGTARGVDRMGERWARFRDVPVERYPADWKLHGRGAGAIRNAEMAKHADALIAIWDGTSRGTLHMIRTAERMGLRVHVLNVGQPQHTSPSRTN